MIPFSKKNWKKFENQGAPSGKRTNPKWPPVGVKIGVFDILSNFGLYFLAESVLLDDFHAKEFIFWGFGKFQLSVFAELPFLFENGCEGAFQFYAQIITWNLFQRMWY